MFENLGARDVGGPGKLRGNSASQSALWLVFRAMLAPSHLIRRSTHNLSSLPCPVSWAFLSNDPSPSESPRVVPVLFPSPL